MRPRSLPMPYRGGQGSSGRHGPGPPGPGPGGGRPGPGPGPPRPGPPGPGPHGTPGGQGGGGAAAATPAVKPADELMSASATIAEPSATRWECLVSIVICRISLPLLDRGLPRRRRRRRARLPRRGTTIGRWRSRVGDPRGEQRPQRDRSGAQECNGHSTAPLVARWRGHEFLSDVGDVDLVMRQRTRRCHEVAAGWVGTLRWRLSVY
jgi:hypothetical protein